MQSPKEIFAEAFKLFFHFANKRIKNVLFWL